MNNVSTDIQRHYNDSRCKVITLNKIDKIYKKHSLRYFNVDKSCIIWVLLDNNGYYYMIHIHKKHS